MEKHPLLCTKLADIINLETKSPTNQELFDKINLQYDNIVNERLSDTMSLNVEECLHDRFLFVEKDIDYGYAITAHKSQGSTYDAVFVNENDFHRITDIMNYRVNKIERRLKEKNRLRYVAYTRTSDILKIIK